MILNQQGCLQLIQKLRVQREQALKVWENERNTKHSPEKNTAKKFLLAFCPSLNFSFLLQNQTAQQALIKFLDKASEEQDLTQDLYHQYIEELKQEFTKIGKWGNKPIRAQNAAANNVLNNRLPERQKVDQIKEIDGKEIEIKVILNSKRMDPKYFYKQYKILDYFERFIQEEIVQTTIKAIGQKKIKILRIFNFKQQFKDNYTGSYVFDPFFNSVKFLFKKKDDSFLQGNFKINNPKAIHIKVEENIQDEFWFDESDFQLNDNINILIRYICQKQNADLQTETKLKESFQQHGYQNIDDLMYNTKESIDKVIFEKKWANQILSQVQKLKGSTPKQFTGNEKMSQEKKKCRRIGNSHKILRYLFYKVGTRKDAKVMENQFMQNLRSQTSLNELNNKIPKINHSLMKEVIKISQEQLMIEDLFPQLERYFRSFTQIPDEKESFQNPYGVLFYGPPGTGKTRLTEDLAELMGFHLVSHGLSSAQFMKELVGQAKGTVHSFLCRAQASKHLICSLAIDQIDAIVGDRRKQNSKGSQQTVAMFLSALGGNQMIKNILVFGSTNFRNLIDDAILRRLTPDFYVRLPSKQDRKRIVKKLLPSLSNDEKTLQFIASITPNYSGAAMKLLCQKYSLWKKQSFELSKNQLIKIATEVAVSYKIKFGDETYPQLYQRIQKQINMNFLKSTYNKVLIVQKIFKNHFKIYYSQQQKYWVGNRLQSFNELKSADFQLAEFDIDSNTIVSWIYQSLSNFNQQRGRPEISTLKQNQFNLSNLRVANSQKTQEIQNIYFITEVNQFNKISFEQKYINNIGIIYYLSEGNERRILNMFDRLFYKNKSYTGRTVVDLTANNSPGMIFELEKDEKYPNQIEKKPFFHNRRIKLSKDALPQIVQFLMSKDVQYIQMINSQLLRDNNAFVENDIHTVITSKIDEAKQYTKSSIIIDLSSLIFISENISQTSSGNTTSKNISQSNLYHMLVDLIKNFPSLKQNNQRWMFVIVEDADLLKLLKKDIKFASSPFQEQSKFEIAQNEQKQKLKKQPRRCLACNQIYTHQQNQKQKGCKQHYGLFADEQQYTLEHGEKTLQQIRYLQTELNIGIKEDKNKHRFVYTCCWKDKDSEGCKDFQHWSGAPLQDQIQHVQQLREKNYQQGIWQKHCQKLRKKFIEEIRR